MDGLRILLPEIRAALSHDDVAPPGDLRLLVPSIREALASDEAATSKEDFSLATQISDALPRVTARLRHAYDDARCQLEHDARWTLEPLDWRADLLAAVGKARSEVTHTLCLAHLLDSRGAHGLGVRVLRELSRLLGRLIPGEDIFERLGNGTPESDERLRRVRVTAEHIVEAPFESGTTTEERRCDLWLELLEEGHALVVVIENKIDAGEHDEQLASYERAVWKWARDRRRNSFEQRLVFLTPDGRAPDGVNDHPAWLPISYQQLAATIARATRDAPEPGRTFASLYVSTILKSILGITPDIADLNFVRHLAYLNEVIAQGAST
jgi:hypothetical protein